MACGANESTVPEAERTKFWSGTGVCPCTRTKFVCKIEEGSSGAVVLTVIGVLTGTPRLPSAGEMVAAVTVPASTILAATVCPAVTCAVPYPAEELPGTLALIVTKDTSAGTK